MRLRENSAAHYWALRLPLLGLVSKHDAAARAQLVQEARNGSSEALAALGDVRELTTDVAADLIAGLARHTDRQVRDARNSRYGFGGIDYGQALAVLNVWHPTVADWEALFRLLAEQAVSSDHKRGAFRFLTASADRLPDGVKHRLEPIAIAVTGHKSAARFSLMGHAEDAAGAATELAVALGEPRLRHGLPGSTHTRAR
jgi:hypothetical protein